MVYSIKYHLPKVGAIAMRLLIADGLPSAVVANKCGAHRSINCRWRQTWRKPKSSMQHMLELLQLPTREPNMLWTDARAWNIFSKKV